jgi:outer membrane protein assembly factor BamE (lipoprotein component of BamABCDE complex)
MNTVTKSIFAVLLFASLSGCVVVNGKHHSWSDGDWKDEQRDNRQAISELEIGLARNQVVGQLGTPNFSEAFTRDGDEFRVLSYRTRHRHSDGETTRDETTPLVFKNDKLIGWGEEVLASIR